MGIVLVCPNRVNFRTVFRQLLHVEVYGKALEFQIRKLYPSSLNGKIDTQCGLPTTGLSQPNNAEEPDYQKVSHHCAISKLLNCNQSLNSFCLESLSKLSRFALPSGILAILSANSKRCIRNSACLQSEIKSQLMGIQMEIGAGREKGKGIWNATECFMEDQLRILQAVTFDLLQRCRMLDSR